MKAIFQRRWAQRILIILCTLQIVSIFYLYKGQTEIDVHKLNENNQLEEENRIEIPDNAAEKEYAFKDFNVNDWKSTQQNFVLRNDQKQYFRTISENVECFIDGTNWKDTSSKKCICNDNYFGNDCGIPDAVWFGHYSSIPLGENELIRRKIPRRIIQGLLFNHEYELLELRLATNYDVVDAFIIQESNYTMIGEKKDIGLFDGISKGWMNQYQDKLLYVFLSFFLKEWDSNGWLAEDFTRNHLSLNGLPLLKNKRDDDLFLLFDADEVPNPSVLLFLKLYDGYSEPIKFNFRWNLYGFFWLNVQSTEPKTEKLVELYTGCTLGMLEKVYDNKAILIRSNAYEKEEFISKATYYSQSHNLKTWSIGSIGHYAGYHCSWCLQPEGIREKLLSAQREDRPRWGNYPEKTKLTYIRSLIESGGWFDGSYPTLRVDVNDPNYAPQYVFKHFVRFKHILVL
ncbi:beta-1,4-mannosyl-glycoprotein 4-beta-N-acetylglucosaminyltransferase isoform X2 [Lepeophtheirus salmonis]|uniref:beta-1,4-mannosyl-glycoprotein 4-beta-N-acetylglucosaminyltransferase isoform X2 n=2 Tax=Lepeophtheirus salmonis TaxID=72036 RepID=UPI001AE7EADD|nr:beta-1,4-mannosyl-glycoprotein 4-beta-N-acetylglucosaminyltransferase-like isoform X2 [Lepeophtheirus salmonis]